MLNYYKRFGIIVDKDNPYDYDTFLKHNNLSATDETYRKFVNYTDTILETLPFDIQSTYEDYQNSLYERTKYDFKEVTTYVYDELNGILYNMCNTQQLKLFRKYGIIPYMLHNNIIYKTYFLKHIDIKHIDKYEDDIVFLKVDLNKSSRKFRFFL